VRYVNLVPDQRPSLDTPPNPSDDVLPNRRCGLELVGPGVEVRERPGEHDLGKYRILPDEATKYREDAGEVIAGARRVRQFRKTPAQAPEALEVDLTNQAGLVAEELVHGRDRGVRTLGDLARGEPDGTLIGQHRHGRVQNPIPQFRGTQLCPWHRQTLGSHGRVVGVDGGAHGAQRMGSRPQFALGVCVHVQRTGSRGGLSGDRT
jgi:hypothetical protein